MSDHKLNLAALLGARICHDLVSPVGAISNGIELLQLSGNLSGPEAGLIGESADCANARLRFFRLAFGQSGADQWISGGELKDIVAKNYADGGFKVRIASDSGMKRSQAQVMLLLLMCCETHVMRRGEVVINGDGQLTCRWQTALAPHSLMTNLLENRDWPPDLAAADVHFPLAREALKTNRMRLRGDQKGQVLTLLTEPALPELQINREPSRPRRQGT